MSKILFAVAALCLVQIAYGRARANTPTTTTASPFVDAWNLGSELVEQVHRSFLNVAGAKSDDEFWTNARNQLQTYQNTLTSTLKDLQEETKPLQGKAEELVNALTTKVTEVTNEIKAKHPELSGDTKKLQEVAERSLRTVVDEHKKLRTRLEAEGQRISPKLEETLKAVYDSSVKAAQDFKTQAEKTINEIQKKN